MVVSRLLVLTAVLVAASCTSVFDSYFPNSVEYLENRVNLKDKLSGRSIVSVRMQVMQQSYAHSYDILVVIANTSDGDQSVLFYDGQLTLRTWYKGSELSAANNNVAPDLYPIVQDYSSLHTGQIEYQFSGGAPVPVTPTGTLPAFITPGSTGSGSGFSNIRSTYYEDLTNNVSYPALFTAMGNQVGLAIPTSPLTVKSLYDLPSGTTGYSFPNSIPSGANLLDVSCWDKTYRFVLGASGSVALATLNQGDAPTKLPSAGVVLGQPKGNGIDLSQGWATATAAVVRNHGNNSSELVAFSWSGVELGRIQAGTNSGDGSDGAFAFHPNGKFWYSYDPSTGMISEYKAWW